MFMFKAVYVYINLSMNWKLHWIFQDDFPLDTWKSNFNFAIDVFHHYIGLLLAWSIESQNLLLPSVDQPRKLSEWEGSSGWVFCPSRIQDLNCRKYVLFILGSESTCVAMEQNRICTFWMVHFFVIWIFASM